MGNLVTERFGGTGQIFNLGPHFFPKKGGGMHPTLLLYSVYLLTILLVKGRVLVALIGLSTNTIGDFVRGVGAPQL
jgi:hypothetical protein